MPFPMERPRRLRENAWLRDLVGESVLTRNDLIYPLFVSETVAGSEEIASMPGQYRHSIDNLLKQCELTVKAGIRAILLFGIPREKDPLGRGAYAEDGIIQRAVRSIKQENFPLLLITDVCLCEYTSHGHCGVVKGERIDNDETLQLLAAAALSQAQAGADMVAPSDMMDGRVQAIRRALDQTKLEHVPIMAYSAKYASAFYGPFREAADSAPQFGDRRSHQMNPANRREALREVLQDLQEGADIVMVKPALAYLDVIHEVRNLVNVPVAAYNVSGEYAMVEFAARRGVIDRQRMILEILTSIKRAGADLILSYHALEASAWI
jgi:porphobilinogen synthase